MRRPVVLNMGMGIDSICMYLRYEEEPAIRDFDWQDLIVVSAQTGNEFEDTKLFMEQYVLPRMRARGTRYIQVARAGPSFTDGITILDDSRSPTICHTEGDYTLGQEMLIDGVVPQYASGRRKCSSKFKAFPLDTLFTRLFGDQPFRSLIGYNADEMSRVARAQEYTNAQRPHEFPLVTWGWDRVTCESYIEAVLGQVPHKSCCVFCPFSCSMGSVGRMLARYREYPDAASYAMLMEYCARALNPRMTLYSDERSVIDLVQKDGNEAALESFQQRLRDTPWAVYRVRRIYHERQMPDREVTRVFLGTRDAANARLNDLGIVDWTDRHHRRVYHQRKTAAPCREEFLVVCPAIIRDKSRSHFTRRWANDLGTTVRMAL